MGQTFRRADVGSQRPVFIPQPHPARKPPREPASLPPSHFAMAPHLTLAERDLLVKWPGAHGLSPVEVHEKLSRHRAARGVEAPNLTNVRKALKGLTYQCGVEASRHLATVFGCWL